MDLIDRLCEMCNEYMHEHFGSIDFNMRDHCYENDYCSRKDVIDANGNIVETNWVITITDLQDACNDLGIDIDVTEYCGRPV